MQKMFILCALALVAFSQCKPDPQPTKGQLNLRFTAKDQASPLVLFRKYPTGTAGDSVEYQLLNFFVADIQLLRNGQDPISIKEVGYLDFSADLNETQASQGHTLVIDSVPVGEYTGIKIGFGLSPSLNATEPGDYTTASPLGDGGNYWTAWNSYIFSRVEGRLFRNGQSTPIAFLYHSGVDGSYQIRTYTFAQPLSIGAGSSSALSFSLNVRNLLFGSQNPIDVAANPVSHSGAVGTAAYELARQTLINLADGITLNP
jgi:hypothetical protein